MLNLLDRFAFVFDHVEPLDTAPNFNVLGVQRVHDLFAFLRLWSIGNAYMRKKRQVQTQKVGERTRVEPVV